MYNIHQKKIFHYLKKGSMREIQTVMLFESYILYRSGSGILPLASLIDLNKRPGAQI